MVLYLASDLLWATRIKSCADDLAPPIPARPVRTLDMLNARLADSPVRGLLLDLSAGEPGHEGEIAFAMLERVKGRLTTEGTEGTEEGRGSGEEGDGTRGIGGGGAAAAQGPDRAGPNGGGVGDGAGRTPIRVVVFGPHVEGELLHRARGLGADGVMTRGALAAHLPRVLTELEGR